MTAAVDSGGCASPEPPLGRARRVALARERAAALYAELARACLKRGDIERAREFWRRARTYRTPPKP